jgi:hypothetical protein
MSDDNAMRERVRARLFGSAFYGIDRSFAAPSLWLRKHAATTTLLARLRSIFDPGRTVLRGLLP